MMTNNIQETAALLAIVLILRSLFPANGGRGIRNRFTPGPKPEPPPAPPLKREQRISERALGVARRIHAGDLQGGYQWPEDAACTIAAALHAAQAEALEQAAAIARTIADEQTALLQTEKSLGVQWEYVKSEKATRRIVEAIEACASALREGANAAT